MSAKAIREHQGKQLLARHVREWSNGKHVIESKSVLVTPDMSNDESLDALVDANPWLTHNDQMLVVKPDQLIKRRGKAGLVGIKLNFRQVKEWIQKRRNTNITIDGVEGLLHTFVIDPFVEHTQDDEYYICIQSDRDGEEILFYNEGGVDVGDVDSKAKRLHVSIGESLTASMIRDNKLLEGVPDARIENLSSFVAVLFEVYRKLNFTYMEINPIVFCQETGTIVPLDLAAKIDETAAFLNASDWGGPLDLPAAFGRQEFPEETYIRELDSKTGASLKLTVLNPKGKIWTMVRVCQGNCKNKIYCFFVLLIQPFLFPFEIISSRNYFFHESEFLKILSRLLEEVPRSYTPIPFPIWVIPTN